MYSEDLSLEEKIGLMSGNARYEDVRASIQGNVGKHYNETPYEAGGLSQCGIPPLCFADGPRGIVCGRGLATCFPAPVMRGASFDTELEEEIGKAVAEEASFFGANLFGGVCINLLYHPGWGRSQETYGEDSFHLGEMGAAMVRGVQKRGVIACVKHFAANSMENAKFKVNIDFSERTEREVLLPHFRKCIDAGALAVMSAYNRVKGSVCAENRHLLKDILKGEWGFQGIVISDFNWGIRDTVRAANAGLDIEMPAPRFFGKQLLEAVRRGDVEEAVIDEAAERIIRTAKAFPPATAGKKKSTKIFAAHRKLALRSAREGIVLLKNRENCLPLKRKEGSRILLLGRLADENNLGDRGSGRVYPPYVTTVFEGVSAHAQPASVRLYTGSNMHHAKLLASKSDAVVITVGCDASDEGECLNKEHGDAAQISAGGDRTGSLSLHEEDIALIREIAGVNKRVVVVLIGGGMIMTSPWEVNCAAILHAFYPGMEGGNALGEILFGKCSPSGKLPFCIPEKEEDLPEVDWDGEYQYYSYYHGYAHLDHTGKKPAYPYGFGLSYTSFALSGKKLITEKEGITAEVTVTNTGKCRGAEVVQVYVGAPYSTIERAKKRLKGFRRVELEPGRSEVVSILIPLRDLEYYDEGRGGFRLESTVYRFYIGTSSSEEEYLDAEI